MKSLIFVSYGRKDLGGHAARIADRLRIAFGAREVFLDADSILAGAPFPEVIAERIARSHVLVAVIGPDWLATRRELLAAEGEDWVRREIRAALQDGITIIPVLLGGATMPAEGELPADIRALAALNAYPLDPLTITRDVDGLARAIKQYLPWTRRVMVEVFAARGVVTALALVALLGTLAWLYVTETVQVTPAIHRVLGFVIASLSATFVLSVASIGLNRWLRRGPWWTRIGVSLAAAGLSFVATLLWWNSPNSITHVVRRGLAIVASDAHGKALRNARIAIEARPATSVPTDGEGRGFVHVPASVERGRWLRLRADDDGSSRVLTRPVDGWVLFPSDAAPNDAPIGIELVPLRSTDALDRAALARAAAESALLVAAKRLGVSILENSLLVDAGHWRKFALDDAAARRLLAAQADPWSRALLAFLAGDYERALGALASADESLSTGPDARPTTSTIQLFLQSLSQSYRRRHGEACSLGERGGDLAGWPVSLLYVVGTACRLAPAPVPAVELLRRGTDVAERTLGMDPELLSSLRFQLARALYDRDRSTCSTKDSKCEPVPLLRAALSAYGSQILERDYTYVLLQSELALYDRAEDPAAAAQRHQAAEEVLHALALRTDPGSTDRARVITQQIRQLRSVASLQRQTDRIEAALGTLQKAERLALDIGRKSEAAAVSKSRGDVLNHACRLDEAMAAYSTAQALIASAPDLPPSFAPRLTLAMGSIELKRQHWELALEINLEALALALPAGEGAARSLRPRSLATFQNNLGKAYYGMRQYASALTYFERAIAMQRRSGANSGWTLGWYRHNLALAYAALGRHADALAAFEDALQLMSADGQEPASFFRGQALTNHASLLDCLGRGEDANIQRSLARAVNERIGASAAGDVRQQLFCTEEPLMHELQGCR